MLLPQVAPPTVAAPPAPRAAAAAALDENGAATPSAAAPSAVVPSAVAGRNHCSLRRRRPPSSAADAPDLYFDDNLYCRRIGSVFRPQSTNGIRIPPHEFLAWLLVRGLNIQVQSSLLLLNQAFGRDNREK